MQRLFAVHLLDDTDTPGRIYTVLALTERGNFLLADEQGRFHTVAPERCEYRGMAMTEAEHLWWERMTKPASAEHSH